MLHIQFSLRFNAMAGIGSGQPADSDAHVTDLLQNLNLTVEEDVVEFNDDQDVGDDSRVEWALFGKVLSPLVVHATTIFVARHEW